MKKIPLALTFLFVLLLPQITLAAWWNPLTWFASEAPSEITPVNQPVSDSVPESTSTDSVIQVPTVRPSANTSEISSLQSKINSLNQENTSLENQLADIRAKYNSCIESSVTSNTSSEDDAASQEASRLRVELATLDQIDLYIDAYSQDDLLDLLNQTETLSGDLLFPVPAKSVTHYWTRTDLGLVTMDYLHVLVENYRSEVKIELARYQDVP